jgi:hypothetical protein
MKKLMIAIYFLLSTSAYADHSTTYYSDGSSDTTMGNTTYFSDGSTATQSGNTTYYSNGETSITQDN